MTLLIKRVRSSPMCPSRDSLLALSLISLTGVQWLVFSGGKLACFWWRRFGRLGLAGSFRRWGMCLFLRLLYFQFFLYLSGEVGTGLPQAAHCLADSPGDFRQLARPPDNKVNYDYQQDFTTAQTEEVHQTRLFQPV